MASRIENSLSYRKYWKQQAQLISLQILVANIRGLVVEKNKGRKGELSRDTITSRTCRKISALPDTDLGIKTIISIPRIVMQVSSS